METTTTTDEGRGSSALRMSVNRCRRTIEGANTMMTTEQDLIKAYEREYDITLEALPETVAVRGNASAWGDEEDKAYEDRIIARLDMGDIWAWCTAKVTVRDSSGREASDYLGCCCYGDARDFKLGGYYLDMIKACADELEENK